MNKWRKWIRGRTLPAAVMAGLAVCILFGCAGPAGISKKRPADGIYPLQTQESLTYWVDLNDNIKGYTDDLGKTPFAQELQKETGVLVNYIHPRGADPVQQFKLMLASGDLPDIIEFSFANLPGGWQKVYSENYIMRLNEVIDKWSPQLKEYQRQHPEQDKMMRTDTGDYLFYPFIRESEALSIHTGPMVRGDWLEELGLPVPETIEDWHQTLRAMKEQKGAAAPLTYQNNFYGYGDFCGAYGEKNGFYIQDGQVVYGAAQPGYQEFLSTFRQWYAEGLIDPDIASVDKQTVTSNIAQGKSGATVALAGNGMGRFNQLLQEKDPSYKMVAAPHPVLNRGDVPKFGYYSWQVDQWVAGTCITTSCKNVELAARYLDFGYGEQGKLLYNFGTEGESYEMKDGKPVYTDKVLHPQQMDVGAAIAHWARGNQNGPFIQMEEYQSQYYQMPEQREAIQIWSRNNAKQYEMPCIAFTAEESMEAAQIQEKIDGYVGDMTNRFILGIEPMEHFNTNYLATLREFGLPRLRDIYQQAYERYLKR